MVGRATISVEIELGWGFHDRSGPESVPELSENGQKERDALRWFLDLCDETETPVSFDIVGHLLLDSCDGEHPGPHKDGWFDRDPGTDARSDPLFYAPEIAELIESTRTDHEICTHTFSHVLFDEVSREVIDWELDRVSELHECNVTSLVPPRHRKPPYDVLREHGIDVVRRAFDEDPPNGSVSRFYWTLTRSHRLDEPRTVDEVTETRVPPLMTLSATYLSRGTSDPHPAYRIFPRRIRQRQHERFLRSALGEAIREDRGVHYWTHLYNIAHPAQRRPIRGLLEAMNKTDRLKIRRMSDLASGHM